MPLNTSDRVVEVDTGALRDVSLVGVVVVVVLLKDGIHEHVYDKIFHPETYLLEKNV